MHLYLDLEVEVEEKPTGYFSIQGGYSSVEALLLGVQIQENNLFGYGKSLGASVTVGTVSQNFLIDYFDPYFLDTSYQFGLQLFKREYQYIDYDTQFDKAFLDPMKAVLNAIGWSDEKKITLESFFS